MTKLKKVIFTGGHHSSGLVVAEAMKKAGWEVIWIGHRRSMRGDESETAEYLEVVRAGITFYELKTAKIYRVYHPLRLLRVFFGFAQSFSLLKNLKPDLVFSFGGYLAPPVVLAAWFKKIPVVTHEQTIICGWANRFIARFAQKVFVSWPESKKWFSAQKVVVTGLPLRPEIFKPKDRLFFPGNRPTIYISGGKQGSHAINEAVEMVLPKLVSRYNLIHQTGSHSLHQDFKRLTRIKDRLDPSLQPHYLVREYFFRDEIGMVFAVADLVVGRSGAHFCAEIMALRKKAILIPLPFSSRGEQSAQAKVLRKAGLARVIDQSELTGGRLLEEIERGLKIKQRFNLKNRFLGSKNPIRIILSEVKKICA